MARGSIQTVVLRPEGIHVIAACAQVLDLSQREDIPSLISCRDHSDDAFFEDLEVAISKTLVRSCEGLGLCLGFRVLGFRAWIQSPALEAHRCLRSGGLCIFENFHTERRQPFAPTARMRV